MNIIQLLGFECWRMLRPLRNAVEEGALPEYFEKFGWWPQNLSPNALDHLGTSLQNLSLSLSIDDLSASQFLDLIQNVKTIINAFSSIPHVGQKIFSEILYEYLRDYHPTLLGLFTFLEVIQLKRPNDPDAFYLDKELHLENLNRLLSPSALLETYHWEKGSTEPLNWEGFLSGLQEIANGLGSFAGLYQIPYEIGRKVFGQDAVPTTESSPPAWSPYRALRIPFIEFPSSLGLIQAGLWIVPTPRQGDSSFQIKGLTLIPYGDVGTKRTFPLSETVKLDFQVQAQGDLEIRLFPEEVIPPSAAGTFQFLFQLLQENLRNEPIVLLGGTNSSHFEYKKLNAALELLADSSNHQDLRFDFALSEAMVVLKGGDGDGFISKILPSDPLRINFDLGFGWSIQKGFYIKGGAGLEYTFQLNRSLGPLLIHSIDLGLVLNEQWLAIDTAVSAAVDIGPVHGVIQHVGLQTKIVFNRPGILGNADVDVGFKPPSQVGLSIEAAGIKGGGFLAVDPPIYFGILSLSFEDSFDLTAIGLISTQISENQKGFSMLFSIMAQFQPVQLGFGFALNGVGGLIGIHRAINEEGLQKVFKDHSLDAILFPESPIRDAPRILSAITTVFPPREGRYAFGFMALITWGASIVEGSLGVLLELGGQGKIALIGQIQAILPDKESALVSLHMDILGLVDFGKQLITIDATLYNSKILIFAVSGDMAMRLNYSESNPDFALAVGGFFPGYRPNMEFPTLRRITVQLEGDIAELRMESYFAITSNSVQIGASLRLHAGWDDLGLVGGGGYDAIISFSPFSFKALVYIYVKVYFLGENILSIDLRVTLSGPNPFHAVGYAKISLFFFSVKVDFDATFGERNREVATEVSPLTLLLKEAADARNISFVHPDWATQDIVLKENAKEEKYLDPFGTIVFSQKAVPLELEMECYANISPPQDEHYLEIALQSGENGESVYGKFAPAQFFKWSDKEKIQAPAFESFVSGKSWGGSFATSATFQKGIAGFETIIWEKVENKEEIERSRIGRPLLPRFIPIDGNLEQTIRLQGAGSLFKPGKLKPDPTHPNYVAVSDLSYTVTSPQTQNGKFLSELSQQEQRRPLTYTEAKQWADKKGSAEATVLPTSNTFTALSIGPDLLRRLRDGRIPALPGGNR